MANVVRINLSGVFAEAVALTAVQLSVERGAPVTQAEVVRLALIELWGSDLEMSPGFLNNKNDSVKDRGKGVKTVSKTGPQDHRQCHDDEVLANIFKTGV